MAEDDYDRLSKYALHANDILVSVVGTLGNACIIQEHDVPAIFSCKSTAVKAKDVNPFYLLSYLNSKYGKSLLCRKERGAIQKGLNLDDLKTLDIPLFSDELSKNTELLISKFCRRKDNENIKFSILIGAPKPLMLEEEDFSILGIREYTWQWPSQMYPSDTLLLAQGLTREEYYSRFLPAILKVDGVDDKLLIRAIREARSARFEFGETPKGR